MIEKDRILMRGSQMYIPYDAHSKTHDNAHVVERNERDKGHNCDRANDCNLDNTNYFDHATLRRTMLNELHQEPYSTHPSYQKIIKAMRKLYFWLGMKRDIATYITRC